jgi:hypothetical protein
MPEPAPMLQKIRGVRQDDARRERHWFHDEFFDLFVWTGPAGEVLAFQLCYDRLKYERVLAWSDAAGFIHRRIDDGEELPIQKMAPIMIADGQFAAAGIAAEFKRRSSGIDTRMRNFIHAKIGEAGTRLSSPRSPS